MARPQKGFYISPPVLIGANSALLLTVGILFPRRTLGFWDGVLITVGFFLLLAFFFLLYLAQKAKAGQQNTDKPAVNGIFQYLRNPDNTGALLMNLAFLCLFRTIGLLPVVLLFGWLWRRKARQADQRMLRQHGDAYQDYMQRTGMLFPKLRKAKAKSKLGE